MLLSIPQPQPLLTEEQQEKIYWDNLKFDSHKWVESVPGYYTCEFCNTSHTSLMPLGTHSLCSKNPHLK